MKQAQFILQLFKFFAITRTKRAVTAGLSSGLAAAAAGLTAAGPALGALAGSGPATALRALRAVDLRAALATAQVGLPRPAGPAADSAAATTAAIEIELIIHVTHDTFCFISVAIPQKNYGRPKDRVYHA